MGQEESTVFWILNSLHRPCIKAWDTSLWHYWQVVEPQEVEHNGKKLGYWGSTPKRGIGIPASSCLCFSVAMVIGFPPSRFHL